MKQANYKDTTSPSDYISLRSYNLSLWLVEDTVHGIQESHLLVHVFYCFFVKLQQKQNALAE